jgi:hypothetical protein
MKARGKWKKLWGSPARRTPQSEILLMTTKWRILDARLAGRFPQMGAAADAQGWHFSHAGPCLCVSASRRTSSSLCPEPTARGARGALRSR